MQINTFANKLKNISYSMEPAIFTSNIKRLFVTEKCRENLQEM